MRKYFQVKTGSRRFVILIGSLAIKFPKVSRYVSFIRGIEENLEERYWYSADGSRKISKQWTSLPLARIRYADRFGMCVIMDRLNTDFFIDEYTVSDEWNEKFQKDFSHLKEQLAGYKCAGDLKYSNVGYDGDTLKAIDYGYFGATPDCYIGN